MTFGTHRFERFSNYDVFPFLRKDFAGYLRAIEHPKISYVPLGLSKWAFIGPEYSSKNYDDDDDVTTQQTKK